MSRLNRRVYPVAEVLIKILQKVQVQKHSNSFGLLRHIHKEFAIAFTTLLVRATFSPQFLTREKYRVF